MWRDPEKGSAAGPSLQIIIFTGADEDGKRQGGASRFFVMSFSYRQCNHTC